MEDKKVYCLQGLNDFLGDAIDNDDVSAKQIAQSLKDELKDLAEYHEEAARKCRLTLNMLNGHTSTTHEHISNFFPYQSHQGSYFGDDTLEFKPSLSFNYDTISL